MFLALLRAHLGAPRPHAVERTRRGRSDRRPSILSADFARLGEEVAAVERRPTGVHVDVMDNHFVPNLTLGAAGGRVACAATALPIDCHLMIDDPDRWAPAYAEAGAASVTFHVEAAHAPIRLARELRALGSRAGMALKPATPVEPYADLLGELDMLLVMTVEPGFGGQRFLDLCLPKIRRAPASCWTAAAARCGCRSIGAVVLDAAGQVVGEGTTAPGRPARRGRGVGAGRRARPRRHRHHHPGALRPHRPHHGPCSVALLAAGVAGWSSRCCRPTGQAGGRRERLRAAGVAVSRSFGMSRPRPRTAPWRPGCSASASSGRRWSGRSPPPWTAGWLPPTAPAVGGRTNAAPAVHRAAGAPATPSWWGIGTALAQQPRADRARQHQRRPPAAAGRPDRRGRVPATARVHDDAAPTLVSRAAGPAELLAELWDHDVRRVLPGGRANPGRGLPAGGPGRRTGASRPAAADWPNARP